MYWGSAQGRSLLELLALLQETQSVEVCLGKKYSGKEMGEDERESG